MKTRKDYPPYTPSNAPLFEEMTPRRIKWFWSKVDRSGGEDACHPWTGYLQTLGYGQAQWVRNYVRCSFLAHRIAWALTYGIDPATHDQVISHTCGNRRCCNPRHLVLSTYRDVGRRSPFRVGRYAFGKCGADAHAARYSWEQRAVAERLRRIHHWPAARIAAYLGCHRSTVYAWTTPP